MTGNIKSYSRILNDQKGSEKIQNYNNMALGLEMMNADKDSKTKDSAAKRVQEAARTAQRKEEKEADEANKQNELLAGFENDLKKGTNGIILFSDAHIRLYIHYYFQKKVVNLTKTKKAELKSIILPLLECHRAAIETTMSMFAEMSVGESVVASPEASTGA